MRYFAVIALLLLFSCSVSEKKNFSYIHNDMYTAVKPDAARVSEYAASFFKKHGFHINKIKVDSYIKVTDELRKNFEVNPDIVLFLEPFLAPLAVNWSGAMVGPGSYAVTYGPYSSIVKSKIPIFNISWDVNLLYSKIHQILKTRIRENRKALVLIDKNNNMEAYLKTLKNVQLDNFIFSVLDTGSSAEQIQELIDSHKIAYIVLFAGLHNRIVNTLDDRIRNGVNFIEVETSYIQKNERIMRKIDINYIELIKMGLNSAEFTQFGKDLGKPHGAVNYIISDPDIVTIK